MSEATLLLRLAAPTQAWDTRQRHVLGDESPATMPIAAETLVPTATSVAGMLACALGRERGEDMSDLRGLSMVVRVDQPGTPRTEFSTTRRRTSMGDVITRPRVEKVLDDAAFLVGVGGDRAFLERIEDALSSPRWALFLGKKAYPPTLPISLGVVAGDPERVVRGHPWIASGWYRAAREGLPVLLRMVGLDPWDRGFGATVELDACLVP